MRSSTRELFDGQKLLSAEDILFADVEQRMKLLIQTESHEDKLLCLLQLHKFRRTVGKCYFIVDALASDDHVTVVAHPSQMLMLLDNMEPDVQVLVPTRMNTWHDAAQLHHCLRTDALLGLRARSLRCN